MIVCEHWLACPHWMQRLLVVYFQWRLLAIDIANHSKSFQLPWGHLLEVVVALDMGRTNGRPHLG